MAGGGGKGGAPNAGGGNPASMLGGMGGSSGGTSDPYYNPNDPYSPSFAASNAFTDPLNLAPESLGGGQAPWQSPNAPTSDSGGQPAQAPSSGAAGGQGTQEASQTTTSSPEVKAIADAVQGGNQGKPVGPTWFQQTPDEQQTVQGGPIRPGAESSEATLRAMAGVPPTQPAAAAAAPQAAAVDPSTSTGLPAGAAGNVTGQEKPAAVAQAPVGDQNAPAATPGASVAQTRAIGRQRAQDAAAAPAAAQPQGFDPVRALQDLLTQGPQKFFQDLAGMNQQVGNVYRSPLQQYGDQQGRLRPRAAEERARRNRLAPTPATAPVATAPIQPVTPSPPAQTSGIPGAPGAQSGATVAPAPPGSPQATSGQAPVQKPDGSAAPTNGMPGGTTGSAPPPTQGYGASADQQNRPRHYTGKITVNGHQYDFGSGGGQFPSLPYGRYHVHPGAIGTTGKRIHAFAGISDSNNPGNNTVNDPLYTGSHGHAREGVEIHPDVSWRRGGHLVTNGCIGIDHNQAGAFGRDLAAASANGPVDLVVGPNGAQIVPADQGANVAWAGQGAGAMPNVGKEIEPMRTSGARTRGDRNNNPGNIKTANAPGQIGRDNQGHAIFRTREDGDRAQADVLRRLYKGQTIPQMGRRYAEDKNWARGVMKAGGYGPNDVPDMDSQAGMARLQRAIQIQEGTWHGGAYAGGGGSSGGAGATGSSFGGNYGGGDETTTPQTAGAGRRGNARNNLLQTIGNINTRMGQPGYQSPGLPPTLTGQQPGRRDLGADLGRYDIPGQDPQSELMRIIKQLVGAANQAGGPNLNPDEVAGIGTRG